MVLQNMQKSSKKDISNPLSPSLDWPIRFKHTPLKILELTKNRIQSTYSSCFLKASVCASNRSFPRKTSRLAIERLNPSRRWSVTGDDLLKKMLSMSICVGNFTSQLMPKHIRKFSDFQALEGYIIIRSQSIPKRPSDLFPVPLYSRSMAVRIAAAELLANN